MGSFVPHMTYPDMTRRAVLSGIAALPLLALPALAQEPALTTGVLDVRSESAVHRFGIEIADDAEERARGLMFRQEMADDAGMLFIYGRDRIASFWMKNTYIPLDMLFIAADGTVMQIAERVQPHDLTPVRSDMPVRAVLEINGGLSAELGIEPGDTVTLYRRKM